MTLDYRDTLHQSSRLTYIDDGMERRSAVFKSYSRDWKYRSGHVDEYHGLWSPGATKSKAKIRSSSKSQLTSLYSPQGNAPSLFLVSTYSRGNSPWEFAVGKFTSLSVWLPRVGIIRSIRPFSSQSHSCRISLSLVLVYFDRLPNPGPHVRSLRSSRPRAPIPSFQSIEALPSA